MGAEGVNLNIKRRKDAKMQRCIVFLLQIFLLLFTFHISHFTVFAQDDSTVSCENLKYVRVAITTNNFKSTVYNQISIIATGEYAAYDGTSSRPLAKFTANDVLKIAQSGNTLILSVNGKTVAKNTGTVVLDCPTGLLGVENLKRNGKQAFYHGIFEITPKVGAESNQFYLINVVDLQNYLKGVVPNEMPVRFGLEALKAQAIAARNYVLMPRTKVREFDVDDSVASQVYFGAATESSLSNQAVAETEGLVALWGWDLILAQYCSTAGGYTENYENVFSDPCTREFPPKGKPYLQGKPDIFNVAPLNREEEARLFYMSFPDSYDMKSPYYRWQREFGVNELTETLKKTLVAQSKTGFIKPAYKQGDDFGELKELRVKQRGVSGKIIELEIVTEKNGHSETYHVYKELVIRRLIQKNGVSLPSANAVFENLYDINKKLNKIIIYGGGYGHGVGMSQFGAGFMSTSLHKSFDKILKRYYTGITISTIPLILSSDPCQCTVTQNFYATEAHAMLTVDNKYNIGEFNANINGRNVAFELANSIVPIHRVSRIDISSYIKKGRNTVTFKFPENHQGKGIRVYIELVGKDDGEYNF